jgi:hypothetical protein
MSRIRTMSRQIRALSAAAVLGVATFGTATACGPFHRSEEEAEERAEIEFVNESLAPADIYAVMQGSESVRIGTVMAGRTEVLRIPQQMVDRASSLSIVARPLAQSRSLSTGPVSISRGERLQVRLPISGSVLSVLPSRQ